MKQTTRTLVTTLALVMGAVAVGGVALWAGKDEDKKAEAKEKSEKLFDFDKSKVRALRLEKAGKLVAALERKEGNGPWRIVEPLKTDGDDSTANAMVDQLWGVKQKKDLDDEKDPKPYGLDAPRMVVKLRLDGGQEHALEIGSDNSFDSTLYVRRSGDPTLRVVDGYTKASFEKELFDLRDKRVAALADGTEIRRIDVSGVKLPYSLEKDGTNWKIVKPRAAAADASAADRIVSSVRQLRATAIAAEKTTALAQYGLATPKVTVRLSVGSGKETFTRTVHIGQGKGASAKTYARRDDAPTVYQVDAQILKDLEKDLFELQDKQIVHVDREQVRKVVFESPNGRIEVARTKETPADGGFAAEEFTLLAPQKAPIKKWKMSSALYAVTGLRAAAFEQAMPAKTTGFDKARTVTLLGDKDAVLVRVRIGNESGKRRYVSVEGAAKVALVEKATLDDLPWKFEDLAETPPAAASLPDGGTTPAQASK